MKGKKPHKTVKQLLDEAGLQPTEAEWEKMQTLLDQQLPTTGGKGHPFTSWHTWLITAGIVVAGIVGYLMVKNLINNTKDTTTARQVTPVLPKNDTALADTATVSVDTNANGLRVKRQNQQNASLNDTENASRKAGFNTTNDQSSSPAASDHTVVNHISKKDSSLIVLGTRTENETASHTYKSKTASSKTEHLQQEANNIPADNDNSTALHEKENRNIFPDSINTINNNRQQASDKSTEDSAAYITADNRKDYYNPETASYNKIRPAMGNDTAANTAQMRPGTQNNIPELTERFTGKTEDSTQSNAASSTITKINAPKNPGKKGSFNKSNNNAVSGNAGFVFGLQLSPLQLNMNNSKKPDVNIAPGVHARYTFNRIGVGITLFPFVINSVSRDKFYSRVDTTYAGDTLPVHRTVTLSDYYTQKITSYKGALNISYQLSRKLLLEAGAGVQHLTNIEAEQQQRIERDTGIATIVTSTIRLKGTDSLFKQAAQNTSFLVFNVWYTAGPCQFGIGYTQNNRSWFTKTNNRAAAQIQLNIRYLLDFRKKK